MKIEEKWLWLAGILLVIALGVYRSGIGTFWQGHTLTKKFEIRGIGKAVWDDDAYTFTSVGTAIWKAPSDIENATGNIKINLKKALYKPLSPHDCVPEYWDRGRATGDWCIGTNQIYRGRFRGFSKKALCGSWRSKRGLKEDKFSLIRSSHKDRTIGKDIFKRGYAKWAVRDDCIDDSVAKDAVFVVTYKLRVECLKNKHCPAAAPYCIDYKCSIKPKPSPPKPTTTVPPKPTTTVPPKPVKPVAPPYLILLTFILVVGIGTGILFILRRMGKI